MNYLVYLDDRGKYITSTNILWNIYKQYVFLRMKTWRKLVKVSFFFFVGRNEIYIDIIYEVLGSLPLLTKSIFKSLIKHSTQTRASTRMFINLSFFKTAESFKLQNRLHFYTNQFLNVWNLNGIHFIIWKEWKSFKWIILICMSSKLHTNCIVA